ncbi:MAG: hypothetical protein ACE5NN_06930 [Candidatus Bathyarchaeia archaeon]
MSDSERYEKTLFELVRNGLARLGVDEDGEPTFVATKEGWSLIRERILRDPVQFAQAVDLAAVNQAQTWKEAFVNLLTLVTVLLGFGKYEDIDEIRETLERELKLKRR